MGLDPAVHIGFLVLLILAQRGDPEPPRCPLGGVIYPAHVDHLPFHALPYRRRTGGSLPVVRVGTLVLALPGLARQAAFTEPSGDLAQYVTLRTFGPRPGKRDGERYSRPVRECRPSGPARAAGAGDGTATSVGIQLTGVGSCCGYRRAGAHYRAGRESSWPGSAPMRTAWTTWSGCAGLAGLHARRVVTLAAGLGDGRRECGGCGRRTSVTAGTVFDRMHTPLTVWFHACWLFATAKDGISAQYLQRTLEIGSYATAWGMLHRLRSVLVRPGRGRCLGASRWTRRSSAGRRPGCAVAVSAERRC